MAVKKVEVEITAETKSAENGLSRVSKALQSVAKSATGAKGNLDKVDGSGLRRVASEAQNAAKQVSGLTAMVEGLSKIAAGGIATDLIQGILGVGASSIQAAAQMRQYEIAFQTMLKSADEGTQMLRDLQQFAATTPFDVPGVVSAGQQLMAFGFQAKQVIPMLTSLGDAAAGLGQGTEGVSRLAYALGQMQTSGKLNAQDMMQLTSAGVAAWDMLAQAAGVSIEEIKDMTSKGMVDSKEAVKVIVAGLNEEFGGMMEQTSNEVSGLVSNIQETVSTTSATIGQYLINAFDIKGVLKEVSDELSEFQSKMQQATDAGESLRDVIKDCVPPEVIIAFGSLATVVGGVLVAALAAAVTALAPIIGVSAGVVAALAGIGAAVVAVGVYWEELVDVVKICVNAVIDTILLIPTAVLSTMFNVASAITGKFGEIWADVTGQQDNWLSSFAATMKAAADNVASFASEAISYFNQVFAAKSKALAGPTPNADQEQAEHAEDFRIWSDAKKSQEAAQEAEAEAPSQGLIRMAGSYGGGGGGGGYSGRGGGSGYVAPKKNEALEAAQKEDRIAEARLKVNNDRIREQLKSEEKLRQTQLQIAKKYGTDEQKLSISLSETEYKRKQDLQTENLSFQEQLLSQENAIKEAKLKGVDQDELDLLEEKKKLLSDNHDLAVKTINAQAEASKQALNADYTNSQLKWQSQYDTADSTVDRMNMDNNKWYSKATADIMGNTQNDLTDEERLEALDQITQKYKEQKDEINTINALQEYGNSLAKSFAGGIADWITGAKSFGEVMSNVLKSLIQQLMQAAMYALIIATFTGGGSFSFRFTKAFGKGFASGGSVNGAGSSTSDSIPAMLSDGEYVMNAKAVRKLGVPFLNGLNTGRLPGFATGGLVGSTAYNPRTEKNAPANPGGSQQVTFAISALDASSFRDFLRNGGGDDIKQMLFDNNRNFTAAEGVW